ncbi:HAD-IA family hydrolase [Vibrio panuliri]|uniref:HAD family hydrolase n=1 Tax=Vibrio panuliri TaxID=1381081 RepID=A0A1Q9HKU1_9VIBR|nr:HAD-IA family hydrolase [Vibrio panuliri]KAB1457347.1 HAD-IA family hydrolase [Vibrio panuliri]OLQ91016.1 HAD family hydrolase [Vibrio panuliri]OLQ91492.1 HAD family hydrolase [Vibrio panuliri]
MNKTQCVIFDCEGTLVDSEILCCQALSSVFETFGATLTVEQAMDHFVGGKLADILMDTRDRLGLNISLDVLEPLYRVTLRNLFESELKPMPGAKSLLKFLTDNNIEYCVVSNGPRDKIEHALELTGLLDYFVGKIYSAFDTNSWKPEPDSILFSAMSMGYRPEECLYIDDTPKGLEAGVRAGIKTIQLEGVSKSSFPGVFGSIQSLEEVEELV